MAHHEHEYNSLKRNRSSSYPARNEIDFGPNKSNKHSRTATPNNRIVADHYNSKVDVGVEIRRESTIIYLRSFNNWIKSVLIGKYVKRGESALDLGCGKGGDLFKWNKAKINKLVGLDVAEVSIEDARKRWEEMKGKKFEAEFHVLDCFSTSISTKIQSDILFDIVSMQFCVHYSFETEEKAHMALKNVTSNLKRGGIFIGTVPDAYWIVKKLKSLPKDQLKFENPIYSIRFEQRDEFPKFGHRYWFYLKDAINDCPEYLVHFPTFEKLANEYGLQLEYKRRFHDLYNEAKEDSHYKDLLYTMRVVDRFDEEEMSEEEWEATGASAGIGEACAKEFAKAGSNLILAARRIERLEKLCEELSKNHPSIKVSKHQLDVREKTQVEQLISSIPSDLKNIDVLVNNAGMVMGKDQIDSVTSEAIDTMIDTNVKGLLYVTRAILPIMKDRQKGHIINVGSVSGTQVYVNGGVYCASKHAVDAISRTLLLELVDTPIRVTQINPGMVETEFSIVRFGGDKTKADKIYEGL
ncbi:13019_t:CDS:10, partial [Funneliformis geosporum]